MVYVICVHRNIGNITYNVCFMQSNENNKEKGFHCVRQIVLLMMY